MNTYQVDRPHAGGVKLQTLHDPTRPRQSGPAVTAYFEAACSSATPEWPTPQWLAGQLAAEPGDDGGKVPSYPASLKGDKFGSGKPCLQTPWPEGTTGDEAQH